MDFGVRGMAGLAVMVVLAGVCRVAGEEYRAFTSRSGKTIRARFVDYDARRKVVLLQTQDGKTASINPSGLSTRDQSYLRKKIAGQALADPLRFRVDAQSKRLTLDLSKDDWRKISASTYVYDLTFKNLSRANTPPFTVDYVLFRKDVKRSYEGGSTSDVLAITQGSAKVEALASGETRTVTTERLPVKREQWRGSGWVSSPLTDESPYGVWLRFYVGEDKDVPDHEMSVPDKLMETETWPTTPPM